MLVGERVCLRPPWEPPREPPEARPGEIDVVIVLANLMSPLLLRVSELLGEHRPRALIVSGLLEGEADEVVAAFAQLVERRRVTDQGWCAVLLVPPR